MERARCRTPSSPTWLHEETSRASSVRAQAPRARAARLSSSTADVQWLTSSSVSRGQCAAIAQRLRAVRPSHDDRSSKRSRGQPCASDSTAPSPMALHASRSPPIRWCQRPPDAMYGWLRLLRWESSSVRSREHRRAIRCSADEWMLPPERSTAPICARHASMSARQERERLASLAASRHWREALPAAASKASASGALGEAAAAATTEAAASTRSIGRM